MFIFAAVWERPKKVLALPTPPKLLGMACVSVTLSQISKSLRTSEFVWASLLKQCLCIQMVQVLVLGALRDPIHEEKANICSYCSGVVVVTEARLIINC